MRSVQFDYDRSPWRRRARPGILLLLLALALCATASRAAPSADQVRLAAEALYIHGMTQEIADREVGPEGLPELIRLLWDPRFERRDNVVAFLSYLGDDDTVPELLRFLERKPFPLASPEEDRALLLVPEALGQIAGRTGNEAALATLLELTAGDTVRDPGLVQMATRGLMYSGAAEARARLKDLATRRIVAARGIDLAPSAAHCLDWLERAESGSAPAEPSPAPRAGDGSSAGSTSRTLAPTADRHETSAAPTDFDVSTVAHDLPIEYANHVNLSAQYRMTDSRLNLMIEAMAEQVGLEDFAEDVACCTTITPSAPGTIFGTSGDGLDVIDTESELDTVLVDTTARVKVVRTIGWCAGGPTTNTIGCAYIQGYGIAVVRYSSVVREAVLWAHEFGHNLGMVHTADPRYIMFSSISESGGLYDHECRLFHFPSSRAEIDPVTVGTCSDNDGDGRHEVIDNCPQNANPDQNDYDGDDVGDVCDNCAFSYNPDQHDDDQDSYGDDCDNCRWIANPDQSDADQDDLGNACDNCPAQANANQADGDADQVGDVCDNCLLVANPTQENGDADSYGDACDNCPDAFNPGQSDFDGDGSGDACEQGAALADANRSGTVDGIDLIRLGLAFGSWSPGPSYEATVDLDRNGRVDGEDLSTLAQYFGEVVE